MKKLLPLCFAVILCGCSSPAPVSLEGGYSNGQTNFQATVTIATNGTTVSADYSVPGTNIQGSVTIPAPQPKN